MTFGSKLAKGAAGCKLLHVFHVLHGTSGYSVDGHMQLTKELQVKAKERNLSQEQGNIGQ